MTVGKPKIPGSCLSTRTSMTDTKAGLLEADMDGDFWADHDERCHGIIDSRELQEEYPEGYNWDCCGQENKTPGCKVGRHVGRKGSSSKRRRF